MVKGASGDVAVVPSSFNIKEVIQAGKRDRRLKMAALLAGPGMGAVARAALIADLAKFSRGGSWDLQRLSGQFDKRYIDSATILIGMFAASAGMSRADILGIENLVARSGDFGNAERDPTFTHLPKRNVDNTDIGMQLVASGAITGN